MRVLMDFFVTFRYTVQCLLSHNLYLEQMYVFLWYWMVFVLLCSLVSLFMWVVRSIAAPDRGHYIQKHLLHAGVLPFERRKELRPLVQDFTYSYLR